MSRDASCSCARRVVESQMEIQGIDWKWAATYVALTTDEDQVIREGLGDTIPRRRSRKGTNLQY